MPKLELESHATGAGTDLSRRKVLAAGAAAMALTASRAWSADAAPWPSKTVRLIVPAPAGGVSDGIARLLAEPMSANLKQPVIVENMPGGSGVIGCRAVLSAPADGHTMLVITSSILVEVPHVVKLPYDPMKDFVQVADMVRMPLVLVGNAAFPARSYDELVGVLKAHPGKYSVASYSTGTRAHYAAVAFNQRAGVDLQHVPYKGSAPAVADLLAGHVPLAFEALPNVVRHIQSGKLRAYAVLGPALPDLLPGVPSLAEKGLPELALPGWQGLWISSATPAPLTQRIHEEVVKAFASSRARQQLAGQGYEFSAPANLAEQKQAFTEAFERNAKIVQKFSIRAD
ncbi:tripartite tricarboxylate transporter substrate binding protein [Ottowia sp.]|jgi:tripartite-type tricarboxylate transporter receptor subunit TctC|uniref:Bug family tripartite tricarboxylate transporter substrate binding protein n=1 Tax=Ottowia sp. TaxID=1898956 RepID=UPI0025E9281B|nr:tripartite tricarboxylate transporter substrate binding protein [Ottowia sp.]MBK6613197.1 tripartite tricarboxylate transporter substrate binding protein [Ottowia sp.]MBK6747693.1 tripartite tricarboxylate transporter substrate binding protein [Ottowia sp.]